MLSNSNESTHKIKPNIYKYLCADVQLIVAHTLLCLSNESSKIINSAEYPSINANIIYCNKMRRCEEILCAICLCHDASANGLKIPSFLYKAILKTAMFLRKNKLNKKYGHFCFEIRAKSEVKCNEAANQIYKEA